MKDEKIKKIALRIRKPLLSILFITVIVMITQLFFKNTLLSQYLTLTLTFYIFLISFVLFIAIEIIINNFSTNIENFTVISLRIAFTIILIAVAFHLISFTSVKYLNLFNSGDSSAIELNISNYNETFSNTDKGNDNNSDSNNITSNPFDQISNEVLLAILSLLIAFAGLLAFIFHHLVRDSIHKELKDMACDERTASKIEVEVILSNVFSRLYRIFKKIECDNKRVQFETETLAFFKIALQRDKTAIKLIEDLNSTDKYKDIILWAWNNFAYNIYLKQKRIKEIDDTEKKGELSNKEKEEKISLKISVAEIYGAVEAKNRILKAIKNRDVYINDYQIEAIEDTCKRIYGLIDDDKKHDGKWATVDSEIKT